MHRAFYRARQDAGAVVHLHSTMATAVACLPDVDAANPIPPLTPYFVMRVGRSMPIVEYYRPGDPAMEPAIHAAAARCARRAAGQSWSGGVGQDADRCGLCGRGTGGGREALSAAARHGAAAADAATGGRSADDVRVADTRKGRPTGALCVRPGSATGAGIGATLSSWNRNCPTASSSQPEPRQQQPSCGHRPSCGPPPSSVRRPSSQRPSSSGGLAAGLLRCGLLLASRPSCGRPSSSRQPSSARPSAAFSAFFFGAAFLRPPARIASASARGCSVVGVSSLLTCRNSFSCRWLQSRGRTATGPAILRGMSSATRANAAHARKRDEPTRRTSAPSSSSHLRSRIRRRCSIDCASPGLVCGQWTVLPLTCALQRFCESDAHTPNPLFLVSPIAVNKKQPFRRKCDEKNAHTPQCDASMSHKTAATSLSRRCVQHADESVRRACRSARTTDFRGRCSSLSGESACCRCAVR